MRKFIKGASRLGIVCLPAVLLGCGPPPGLEAAWQRYRSAQARYESCAEQFSRQPAACDAEHTAYLAERESYHAALTHPQPAAAQPAK